MSQPKWKKIANLGDVNPLDHGGLFVLIDETGVYPPEMERLEPPCDDDPEGQYEVFRVVLERQKEVREGNTIYLVPVGYQPDWPHPVSEYPEWYVDSLTAVGGGDGLFRGGPSLGLVLGRSDQTSASLPRYRGLPRVG